MSDQHNPSPTEHIYRIGSVAKLSGLSSHTIRTWERRYFMESASRTATNRRRYTREDVDKFSLLNWLTDHGEAIGAIAHLDLENLRQRKQMYERAEHDKAGSDDASEPSTTRKIKIGMVGNRLTSRFSYLSDTFEVTLNETDIQNLDLAELKRAMVDVMVIEIPSVQLDVVSQINHLRQAHPTVPYVCLYDFAPRLVVDGLASLNVHLLHWPVARLVFERLLAEVVVGETASALTGNASQSEPTQNHKNGQVFTERQLAAISEVNPSLPCECPLHMTRLIFSLRDFEQYSQSCIEQYPEDAEIHTHLKEKTAESRLVMEKALLKLCEHDNVAIPSDETCDNDHAQKHYA